MSSDEQIPAVSEVEDAKKSDGPSTAGEHSVDKVNDDEQVPQSDEKSVTEKEDEEEEEEEEANASASEKVNGDGKINNNKRDIDHVDKDEEEDEEKKNGQTEEDDEEAVVSTTAANKKVKIMDPLVNENGGDADDTSATSVKVPNEELTVV